MRDEQERNFGRGKEKITNKNKWEYEEDVMI